MTFGWRRAGGGVPDSKPNHHPWATSPRRGCGCVSVAAGPIRRGPIDRAAAHPVRAIHRARRLRVRVRVRHARPAVERDRARCADGAGQPRAPRRQRLRAQHRGRRRDPARSCRTRSCARRRAAPGSSCRAAGGYGVAMVFLPRSGEPGRRASSAFEQVLVAEGLAAARAGATVPTDPMGLGEAAAASRPVDAPGVHRSARRPRPGRGRRPRVRPSPVRRPAPGREGRPTQRAARARGALHPLA